MSIPKAINNPAQYFRDKMPSVSGNQINGQGEQHVRPPSPFFWHKPELHDFGTLQHAVTEYQQRSAEIRSVYTPTADRGPKPIERASRAPGTPEQTPAHWYSELQRFALQNEADIFGVAKLDPTWVYEGFTIEEPWLVMLGVVMEHDKLAQVPPSFENPTSAVEVGDKYNQAARACRKLTNFILSEGYQAKAYQGPYASALNMIPAALAAGFGELGKHGSIINRHYGSSFRLSAVSTDMPLLADQVDNFGADEFCTQCQVCRNACPPDAIHDNKVLVRGIEKWYVDFDKCIPFFGEALGCAACIATCPWSTPGRAPKLAEKWARRVANNLVAK